MDFMSPRPSDTVLSPGSDDEVGTRMLSAESQLFRFRQSSLNNLRNVLLHVRAHLEHVKLRHREDTLHLLIRLDDATLVQLLGLDVLPDRLRDLAVVQLLRAADCSQGRAQGLRGEETNALLLRRSRRLLRTLAPVAAHLRTMR